ncbi:MAG: D-glycerate dehydrogenase [SAR202 cluster bacterium]|nr:D-glycerate dehydrogenase [SAR202 cluster bacterium]
MIDGRVFVTRRVDDEALRLLKADFVEVDVWEHERPPAPDELRRRAAGCLALVTMLTERVDAALLDAARSVRVVANVATGYDNFDVEAARARGVRLSNTPNVLEETTADLALALLLASARRIVETAEAARNGRWGPWDPRGWLGVDAHGATLGIVGMGKIGGAVARRARGFDMRVRYTSRQRHGDAERETGASFVPTLEELLREADFVSLHVPLTVDTRNLMDKAAFAAMKPSATLINTSRGGVVDQDALLDAVRRGHIRGAALDVTTPEPLPPEHPLFREPRVLITPHIGSATETTRRRMAVMAVRNVIAACAGRHMPSEIA